MKKRVLSLLTVVLAVMMVLVILPAATYAASTNDFTIENGVLKKYNGAGGDVVIPDSVTSIRDGAFAECTNLTSITIPNSVTSIGSSAFYGCTGLTSITIPDSVTEIEGYAFYRTPWLKAQGEFVIVNGILLEYQGNDSTVTIPNSVTGIGAFAFSNCKSLTSVVIPDSVTSIGNSAFKGCIGLTSVTIGNSVTSIGSGAFSNCTGLTSITIPNSVKFIGASAFNGCTGLTSITIPNSVTEIEGYAFYRTPWLKAQGEFVIVNGILLEYQGNDSTVTIPNSVTSIGDSAFEKCKSLTSVVIPDLVTSIGSFAFYGCTGLTSITIPDSVTSFGTGILKGCTGLKKVLGVTSEMMAKLDTLGGDVVVGYREKNDAVFNQWAITAEATLKGLENYVSAQSEKVTNLSNEICNGLTSDYEKAKAIFDWMTANVAYDYEYYYDRKDTVITSAEGVMESKLTVCAGYANLTKALLQAQGIPALYVGGKAGNEGHAWNAAYVDGKWIYLDSTWGRPGSRAENGELIDVGNYDPSEFDISVYSLATKRKADPITYGTYSVQASSSTVTVNGTPIGFECYNIGGNNYFKLRDLSAALNGSEKQFNVTWDGEKGAVNIVSNQAYEAVGGELTPSDGSAKNGQVNTASVYVDGYWVLLSGYNIGGNNFVKLRDLAKVLDFGVSWDGTTGTVVIDGNVGYTAE